MNAAARMTTYGPMVKASWPDRPGRTLEDVYLYEDLHGRLLGVRPRFRTAAGKDVLWMAPAATGGLRGGRWDAIDWGAVPYLWPDLEPHRTGCDLVGGFVALWVEGEKAASLLADLNVYTVGLVPFADGLGAAGNWSPRMVDRINPLPLVLVPDHDEAGRIGAWRRALVAGGRRYPVRVLDAAAWFHSDEKGWDLGDLVLAQRAAGRTDEQIRNAVRRFVDCSTPMAAPADLERLAAAA